MNEARIKLAEARGWKQNTAGDWYDSTKEHSVPCLEYELPDPFTDANDDYAVLEWMRGSNFTETDDAIFEQKRFQAFCEELHKEPADYDIGDYARAACKVLEID